jgi:hypothetical protein
MSVSCGAEDPSLGKTTVSDMRMENLKEAALLRFILKVDLADFGVVVSSWVPSTSHQVPERLKEGQLLRLRG